MTNKKEVTKDARILKEERRLRKIYKELDANSYAMADGLIRRAAYLRVTLEDMEIDLDKNGFVEMFTQSSTTPPYEKERVTARHYQQSTKNYQSAMKQLSDLLAKNSTPKGENDDGFDGFVMQK